MTVLLEIKDEEYVYGYSIHNMKFHILFENFYTKY